MATLGMGSGDVMLLVVLAVAVGRVTIDGKFQFTPDDTDIYYGMPYIYYNLHDVENGELAQTLDAMLTSGDYCDVEADVLDAEAPVPSWAYFINRSCLPNYLATGRRILHHALGVCGGDSGELGRVYPQSNLGSADVYHAQ